MGVSECVGCCGGQAREARVRALRHLQRTASEYVSGREAGVGNRGGAKSHAE